MTTYRDAGVDIDAGDEFVERIKPHVRATFRPEVLTDLGGFGGLFRLQAERYTDPVLVSGTDGVGTKLKIAFLMDRHDTVGIDLVAMCVNDIAVSGAEPLFFLDYFATGKLSMSRAEAVVKGIAEGCRQAGCALIGGETAEMPSFYADGEYDLAGFAVGVVDRPKIIDGRRILPEGWVDFARTRGPDPHADVYGAHFWLTPSAGTGAPLRATIADPALSDAFSAQGHEGQLIVIVPSKDLVVVRLGRFDADTPEAWNALGDWMTRFVHAFGDRPQM